MEAHCPIRQQKNRTRAQTIEIIALILHFLFIITLSLYRVFLLKNSKYLQRYYLSCLHTITVSESNDHYQLHFTRGGRKAQRAEASHPSLPGKTMTASKLNAKMLLPGIAQRMFFPTPAQPNACWNTRFCGQRYIYWPSDGFQKPCNKQNCFCLSKTFSKLTTKLSGCVHGSGWV